MFMTRVSPATGRTGFVAVALLLACPPTASAWLYAATPEVAGVLVEEEGDGEALSFEFLPNDPLHPVKHYTVYRGHLGAPFDPDFSTLGQLRTVMDPQDGSTRGKCAVNDGESQGVTESYYFLVTATTDDGEGTLGTGSGGSSRAGIYGDPTAQAPDLYPQSWVCQSYGGEPPPPFDPPTCGTSDCVEAPEFTPLCPIGYAPVPREYDAPKGPPPEQLPEMEGVTVLAGPYYYSGSFSYPAAAVRDGAGTSIITYSPIINSLTGTHSLAELAVQGGPGNGNIVEIGWTVDRGVNAGSVTPHLFVFRWINKVPGLYNGAGWVQYSRSIVPGMALPVGFATYAGYLNWAGNWWAWWNKQWIGYFPGALWGPGVYTTSTLHQWFGEVHTTSSPPGVQMGNGIKGTSLAPISARLLFVCEVDTAAWLCFIKGAPSLSTPTPAFYDARQSGYVAYYGGPG